jgi:hypothetical protein
MTPPEAIRILVMDDDAGQARLRPLKDWHVVLDFAIRR